MTQASQKLIALTGAAVASYLLLAPAAVGTVVSTKEVRMLYGSGCAEEGTTQTKVCSVEDGSCVGCGCSEQQTRDDGNQKLKDTATKCADSITCAEIWEFKGSGTCGTYANP